MPRRHVVAEGECVASIADAYGVLPQAIWDSPLNAALRARREDLYVVAPGDVVQIPDPKPKTVSGATGRTHRFKRKGVPERLSLRFSIDGEPRANEDYVLTVDGVERRGTTDGDGHLLEWIAPATRAARLTLGDDDPIELDVGALPPADGDAGARARLQALGVLPEGDATAESLTIALRRFQREHALPITGELDAATRDRLREEHGA